MLILYQRNDVFLALLGTRELRNTSRDSLPGSREAGAHRKLSKDQEPEPSLSQKAQDEQEPVQSFPACPAQRAHQGTKTCQKQERCLDVH